MSTLRREKENLSPDNPLVRHGSKYGRLSLRRVTVTRATEAVFACLPWERFGRAEGKGSAMFAYPPCVRFPHKIYYVMPHPANDWSHAALGIPSRRMRRDGEAQRHPKAGSGEHLEPRRLKDESEQEPAGRNERAYRFYLLRPYEPWTDGGYSSTARLLRPDGLVYFFFPDVFLEDQS